MEWVFMTIFGTLAILYIKRDWQVIDLVDMESK
jgi:hypothetical protein